VPSLTVFRNSFVNALRANIDTNLDKYQRSDSWISEIGQRSSRDLETSIEIKSPIALEEPKKGDFKDIENAIRLHKLLPRLTLLQARDPRLWTRLVHVDCWKYMRQRWEIERTRDDNEKGVRFIASRYFIATNDSRSLLRNGVARLWWTAHLSHDDSRENPYELTGILLSTLDITQQILERNMGRAPAVLVGFLEFLVQNKALLLTRGDQNRDRIRKLAIFLNMYGGVYLLDCLSQLDVITALGLELQRILENEKRKPAKVKK
jgi:Family of unknown function (DUF6339)